jgi:hypothetical protein
MPRAATPETQIPQAMIDLWCERFPLLLRGWLLVDPSVAPLDAAIRCGRGWTALLHTTFEALEADIEDRLVAGGRLRDMPAPYLVRERFGELRIDLLHGNEHSERVVEAAARLSSQLCARCGAMAFSAFAGLRRARAAPCCTGQASTPATR